MSYALLSVSDKTGIVELGSALQARGVGLLSTGGTAALLKSHGLAVTDVSAHTGLPEMMDGRVKTLHPVIHGGLLARRGDASHVAAMREHAIAPIDFLAVTLYPFEATVAAGASYDEAVEQIDIGGPAMIRAAAKNHADVTVLVDPADYGAVIEALQQGGPDALLRRRLAAKAFARTAAYDSAVARWFCAQAGCDAFPPYWMGAERRQTLRYGENPHQQAAFYAFPHASGTLAQATQHQGKELSYNNINDTDAAWALVRAFDEPAAVLVKHANPCGAAVAATAVDAFRRALACDRTSAYGGILALNRPVDAALAEALGDLFLEVLIAPSVDDAARAVLSKRKNLRLLTTGTGTGGQDDWRVTSISGGFLLQESDAPLYHESELKVVSQRQPTAQELRDLRFAFAVCKQVKSNAIVLAKEGATIGIGAGQMSRIDSVKLAGWKAEQAGLATAGSVLASDAFFPFDDNVHRAAELGVTALIHPGGSIRDADVIAAADRYGMALVATGMRHFNH